MFAAGVVAGVVGLLVAELVIAVAVWEWLTRRGYDGPEEAD